MTSENRIKLNQLIKNWPKGAVAISSWLLEQGVSQQLTTHYLKYEWLERIGRGAFKLINDPISWQGALFALQRQAKLQVHLGGKSALQQQGFAHFIPMGTGQPLYLFGEKKNLIPKWFMDYDWGVELNYIRTRLFASCSQLGMTKLNLGNFSIEVSEPERAILECLYLVKTQAAYDEGYKLMESLLALRPQRLQKLLECCNSIKTKRIFMTLADYCNHGWAKKLNLTTIDFGSGNRSFIKAGYLEPKYKITIPTNFKDHDSDWREHG